MTEDIEVYLKGREKPFIIKDADYLGHTRPDGVITNNWHYYSDGTGRMYHFRKTEIQAVVGSV